MIAVDTNVIVRLLTHDDDKQYQQALSLFQREQIFIPETVILEVEWVLRFAYAFKADAVCDAFERLFGLPNVMLAQAERVACAIDWHRQGMDFADALHVVQCEQQTPFYTFDKKLINKAASVGVDAVLSPN